MTCRPAAAGILLAGLLLTPWAGGPGGPASAQEAPRTGPDKVPGPPLEVYLPFPRDVAWTVHRGNNDRPSHDDDANRYAFDFSPMPEGSHVCACADGIVEFVKQDGMGPTGDARDNNLVVLRHSAAVVSEYVHLRKEGSVVKEGEHVLAGDLIGFSGNTGSSENPHLHFGLRSPDRFGASIPCRFADFEGGVPKKGQSARSGNIPVRSVPGYRSIADAIEIHALCERVGALSVALPAVRAAAKIRFRIERPALAAAMRDRDALLARRVEMAGVATKSLADAIAAGEIPLAVRLAQTGLDDWAELPAAKGFRAALGDLARSPGWSDALKALRPLQDFRRLLAAAAEEQTEASALDPCWTRPDPAWHPDYSKAVKALRKAAEKAADDEARKALDAYAKALVWHR